MENKYVDILLVRKQDGTLTLVTAKSCEADVGDIVVFSDGDCGRVVMKDWGGESDGDLVKIIASKTTVYEADEILRTTWKREESDATNS